MQRQGAATVIDLTVPDITAPDRAHVPVEFPLQYDLEVSDSESNPYIDAGSYEYTYAGTDVMSTGVPMVQRESRVSVLCYKVISSGVKPFIMFGLYRGAGGLGLIDAEIPSSGMFRHGMNDIGKRLGINETIYRGYLRNGEDTVLCIEDAIPEQRISETPGFQWLLSTEIMNQSKALEGIVDPRVVEFFEAYPSLLFLYDELGNLYESPEVGYYETSGCREAYLSVMGAPRDGPSSETGPYYRFLDCDGVVRRVEDRRMSESAILVRFALFLGRTTISGGSADWSRYDSLRTPDGIICVREYNQQIPLSSHSIARMSEV